MIRQLALATLLAATTLAAGAAAPAFAAGRPAGHHATHVARAAPANYVTGRITAVDQKARTVSLANGHTYHIRSADIMKHWRVGETIHLRIGPASHA